MTKHERNMNQGPTTILVVDREELSEICDFIVQESLMSQAQADHIREQGLLPLACKGAKNALLFEKYEIKTPYMAAVLRGTAEKLGITVCDSDTTDQLMCEAEKKLSSEEKAQISSFIDELVPVINSGQNYDKLVKRFLQKISTGALPYGHRIPIGVLQKWTSQTCLSISLTAKQRCNVEAATWDDTFRKYLWKLFVCAFLIFSPNGDSK
jgi:hypothetical protein